LVQTAGIMLKTPALPLNCVKYYTLLNNNVFLNALDLLHSLPLLEVARVPLFFYFFIKHSTLKKTLSQKGVWNVQAPLLCLWRLNTMWKLIYVGLSYYFYLFPS